MDDAKIQRKLKIPGTDISVGETDVKDFYPAALAVTILILFWYRRTALAKFKQAGGEIRPLWLVPVPLNGLAGSVFWDILLNFVGLSIITLCGQRFIEFAYRTQFWHDSRALLVNVVTGLAVLIAYTGAIIRAIIHSELPSRNASR
jgi:hypothetical protein